MYKIISFCLSLFAASFLLAQTYTPIDKGSSIKFTIKNLGINTMGSISGIKGSIHYNISNPSLASFNITIDAATVNTGNSMRDGHLNKDSYFDSKKYPTLSFVSKSVVTNAATHLLQVTGTLTIKGIAKEITFPFTVDQQAKGLLFKGTFPLNRRDFGVGSSSLVLSDNLTVSVAVFAVAQ